MKIEPKWMPKGSQNPEESGKMTSTNRFEKNEKTEKIRPIKKSTLDALIGYQQVNSSAENLKDKVKCKIKCMKIESKLC